jgi:hypothetical protein
VKIFGKEYYQCTYTGGPYPAGPLTYRAEAFDSYGNKGISEEKTIDVTGLTLLPTERISRPTIPPEEIPMPCYISGRLYDFKYYSKTLRVKICEAEMTGDFRIDPFTGEVRGGVVWDCKPDGYIWYENVTRLWAGEEGYRMPGPMAYQVQVPCDGSYLIEPVYQPYGDECEWHGSWIPSKDRVVVMNGTHGQHQEGYDFTFEPLELTPPAITEVSYPENLDGLRLHYWCSPPREFVKVRAYDDASGIQRIKINGNLTATGFISDENGPLLMLDYPNPDRTTFFNISQECTESPCVVNFEGFSDDYPEFTKIDLNLRVSVCDGAGNSVSSSYHKTYTPEGDLEIVSVEPVQVVYGAPLVKNKATAFRVKVNSHFHYPVETKFRLELPDAMWYKTPPEGISFGEEGPPEVWGPIKIPAYARDYEIMLPIISDWQKEQYVSVSNPAGVISRSRFGENVPDTRSVPRPKADRVSFTVVIDPDREITETDEGNNRLVSSDYEVVTTKRFHVYFVLQVKNSTENNLLYCRNFNCPNGCCGNPTCAGGSRTLNDVCGEVKELAKNTAEYLLGVYPVPDSKMMYTVDCNVKYRDDYGNFMGSMVDLAKENDYDYVLAVQPWGRCGCCVPGSDGCYIELYGQPPNAAHELGHGIQEIEYECYSCTPRDCPDCTEVCCDACTISDGFWVNKWIKYKTPRDGPPTYYQDSVGTVTERWTRLERPQTCEGRELPGGYNHLLQIFTDESDPKVLLVSGIVYKNGSVKLEPFKILESGRIDIESGEKGDYYIVLIDSQQRILDKFGFNVSFEMFKPEGIVEMNQTPFVYRIEWKDGTKRIELQDKEGNVLASRDVSPNKPEVKVLYPDGGDVWEKGKTYKVKWEASDKDEDVLTYSLAISMNNGETWLPVDIDIKGNEYDLNTIGLEEGENYLIKVRATDGVNTDEDVSDNTFSVALEAEKAKEFTTQYLVIGAIIAIITLFAVVYLIRRRKKK